MPYSGPTRELAPVYSAILAQEIWVVEDKGEAQVSVLQIDLGAPSLKLTGQRSCKRKMAFGKIRKPGEGRAPD